MNGLDSEIKNRLTLWLRAEAAFGLHSVASPVFPLTVQPGIELSQNSESILRDPSLSIKLIKSPPENEVSKQRARAQPAVQASLIPVVGLPAFSTPLLGREDRKIRLQLMDDGEVKSCVRCRLHPTRTKTVFGEGDPEAKIFFVGEGPGETEDLTGRPFVGRAGQLLDKMIGGMGLKREQVFIANIVKCRPPNNRVPATDEVATCTPYLERQLEIVRPRVIVTLGRPATTYMLNSKLSMGSLRGRWHVWRDIKLMPTFHPSYVLRSYTEEVRAAVWSDLKQVLIELGMPVPNRGG